MPGIDTGSNCIQNPGTSLIQGKAGRSGARRLRAVILSMHSNTQREPVKTDPGPFLCVQLQGKRQWAHIETQEVPSTP